MSFELVIKGGKLFTGAEVVRADIGINRGKIAALGVDLPAGERRTVDAHGKQVLPAAIDAHVHYNLELPTLGIRSKDNYWTGGQAAARGGVTTVLDFSEQRPGEKLLTGVERKISEQIEGISPIDYGIHPTVYDWREELLDEIEGLVEAGFPTVKMFMIYSEEGWQTSEPEIFESLSRAGDTGATILIHCENSAMLDHFTRQVVETEQLEDPYSLALSRPNLVEATAVRRAVELCEAANGRLYVVHLSTGEALRSIEQARQKGLDLFVETCPQFLLLDEELFKGKDGFLYAACPQLKTSFDNQQLWEALETDLIDIVATDNCTFDFHQKSLGRDDFRRIPRGLPGTETVFPLIYTFGHKQRNWSLNRVIQKISTAPAKIHGFYPEKGSLQPGTDADLIIVDPQKKTVVTPDFLKTDCDWSPYTGFELYGFPQYTFCRGKMLVEKGQIKKNIKGHGKVLKRRPA